MSRESEKPHKFKVPDRPLECTECKRPIVVRYTEIVGDTITHTSMCAECPELQKKLHRQPHAFMTGATTEALTTLACGNCGTTLEALRVGTPLGCSNCYEVFGDLILSELISTDKVPMRLVTNKKGQLLHIGRTPGEMPEYNPAARLLALNEALNETLKREDYEQAAWLRDQIKALTDQTPEKKDDQK